MSHDDYITWWRDRYNNLVTTLSLAVDGETVLFSDNDDFPHSDGAKMLLERIVSLTKESETLRNNYDKANMRYCRQLIEIERLSSEGWIMHEALTNITKLDHTRAATNCAAFNAVTFARTALNAVSDRPTPQSKSQERRFTHQVPADSRQDHEPCSFDDCDICTKRRVVGFYDRYFGGTEWRDVADSEQCDHPVHQNPGLIVPCPKCGADDSAEKGQSE